MGRHRLQGMLISFARQCDSSITMTILDSLDPIIGQGDRTMIGLDPLDPLASFTLGNFVTPKGGEYFFSPGIRGLKNTIAKV